MAGRGVVFGDEGAQSRLPTPGMLAKGRRRDIDGAIRTSPVWQAQAIGRSRGGRATKIRATVDARERPIAIEVTPGHLGDVRVATALITGVPAGGCLAADAAYDGDGLRRFLL